MALLRQAAAFLLLPQTGWRDATRFIEAVARLPQDIDGYCAGEWLQQLALRFVKNHQDVTLMTALSRDNQVIIAAIEAAHTTLQSANDQAVAMAKNG
ncbi:hypothetical protein D3C72_2163140 [compost metagenome]